MTVYIGWAVMGRGSWRLANVVERDFWLVLSVVSICSLGVLG
jgi:hypothetical protein